MFAEDGFDGVSIRRIAAGAGVSLAMVHHYFGSKHDLFEACIDSMYEDIAALRPQLMATLGGAAAGGRDVVEAVVRAAFTFAREYQTAGRLLLRQVVGAGELDERRREAFQAPFLDEVSGLLARALGRPPAALRLPIQSIVILVSRFAVGTQRELELFSGQSGDAAVAAVEDHLVRAARALLQ